MSGMDGSPKVLSVTFGEFSVRLEGFDDPVATLIAVAEYFRGLAERDPDFARGAEVPDVAALLATAGAGEDGALAGGPGVPDAGMAAEVPVDATAEGRPDGLTTQVVAGPALEPESSARGAAGAAEPGAEALMAAALPEVAPDLEAAPARGPEAAAPLEAAPDPEVAPASERVPEPLGAAIHDWEADETIHDEDWPEDGDDHPGGNASGGETWAEGRFTARVIGRGGRVLGGAGGFFGRHHGRVEGAGTSPDAPAEMTGGSHDAAGKAAPSAPPVEETGKAAHADGHAGRKLLAASPEEEEEALQRFLSQAERQLSDPEIARRHEAMAHLRAAVAATEAQKALGEDGPADDGAGLFREEWAAVARPQDGRGAPPPLRLVASQRVDGAAVRRAAPTGVAQPVEAVPREAPPAPRSEGMPPNGRAEGARGEVPPVSFAAFAAQAGASATLPDLLEAAAAWTEVVRQDGEVSRSELLRLASEALPEPPSREDLLRVLGILLRTGRLARAGNGRFRVGESTRFGTTRAAG